MDDNMDKENNMLLENMYMVNLFKYFFYFISCFE